MAEERSRKELLELVLVAVDCAKGEAVADGHETYPKLCDEVMFPFLEAEIERESRTELCHVGRKTTKPCKNPAVFSVNHDTPDFCLEHGLGIQVEYHFAEVDAALEKAHKILMDDVRIVLRKTGANRAGASGG